MPTDAPRRLSWRAAGRLYVLAARLRWLNWRLAAAHRRAARLGTDAADDRLLCVAQRWLAAYEEIGRLLPGMPEPEHVRQVRTILAGPDQSMATVDCAHRTP